MLQATQVLQQRYSLQHRLGQQSSSVLADLPVGRQTWLALDRAHDPPQPVVVKLLAFNPQLQWDELKLFEREAQVLQTLNHPCIPRYRDHFSLDRNVGDGLCWFVLVQDYIPGKSLQEQLDQGYHFSEAQIRSIAAQVLTILTYLHGQSPPVLHRDIKPSNLIWRQDEQVYLVDFGAVQDPAVVEGMTFTIVGTAGYAPLEQFWGKAVPASDLYALGATLIHLLTGIAPADLPQNNLRIQFRDRISLQSTLIDWIEFLTDPDLSQRCSFAGEALEALQTGRFGNLKSKVAQPARSRIVVQESKSELLIQVPCQSWSLWSLVEVGFKLMMALGLLPLLLIPFCTLLLGFLWLLTQLYENWISILILLLLVLPIFFALGKNIVGELVRVNHNLRHTLWHHFGQQHLTIGKSLNPPNGYFCLMKAGRGVDLQPANSIGQTWNVQRVEAVAREGLVIYTKRHRYEVFPHLSEAEGIWLAQVIQNWLERSS
ncbi:MAG: serine/threonine-protein kinase [Leptolyngbyaceae cyanobacterium bins.59]|nr:serine/threonine-protein kinase [Leptolyngbyaceae cyanobacterium bins.59]